MMIIDVRLTMSSVALMPTRRIIGALHAKLTEFNLHAKTGVVIIVPKRNAPSMAVNSSIHMKKKALYDSHRFLANESSHLWASELQHLLTN